MMQLTEFNPHGCRFFGQGSQEDLDTLEASLKAHKREAIAIERVVADVEGRTGGGGGGGGGGATAAVGKQTTATAGASAASATGAVASADSEVFGIGGIAAVFTEFPSNPLLKCPDLKRFEHYISSLIPLFSFLILTSSSLTDSIILRIRAIKSSSFTRRQITVTNLLI
jgi:hypothetical protein